VADPIHPDSLKPVTEDTAGPLADFLERMKTIEWTGLVRCVSGQHVVDMTSDAPWRVRVPGESAGYHSDISLVCSLCHISRAATYARWTSDPALGAKLLPRLLHWLLVREWNHDDRCDACSVPRAAGLRGVEAPANAILTPGGHDIQCGADSLLTEAGYPTRKARDDARLALGERARDTP